MSRAIQIIGVAFVLSAVGGLAFLGLSDFSLTDVKSQNTYSFMTNSGASCYYGDVSNGMTIYGDRIYLENHEVAVDSSGDPVDPNKAIATAHYGAESKQVYSEGETIEFSDLIINIDDIESERVSSGFYCGEYQYNQDYINNIIWDANINIPKDQITATFDDVVVEDVGQAEKLVEANITVSNSWNDIETDKMYATVFGQQIDLDSGTISKGEHTYSIVTSKDYYDSSQFIVNKEVTGQLQLHFDNPRVPQDQVSGQPNIDGDYQRYEGFKIGGSQPDIQNLEEGDDRYSAVDSPCDIQFLKQHGFGARDCHDYAGGEAEPMSTQNWKFPLQNIKSVEKTFTTDIKYCGENAKYVDNTCVIDEQLHLRGDLCLLLNNYTMVSEDLTAGQYDKGDLKFDPGYFCTKHPAVVANDGSATGTTVEPYQKMVDGSSFRVPSGQTYQIYYTVNANDVDVNTVCPDDASLNESTGDCEISPGFTHVCSGDSTWSPDTGACVTHPEVKPVCNQEDARYNSKIDKCVLEIKDNNCPVGSVMGPDSEVCYSEASVEKVCPDSIEDGKVKDGQCLSDAKVTLVQRNIIGDWVNAIVSTFNSFIAFVS